MERPAPSRVPAPAHLRYLEQREQLAGLDLRARFEHIYRLWGAEASPAGLGSQLAETEHIRAALPVLLQQIGAETLLDAGCGDFTWMGRVALPLREYIGGDIVPEIAAHNQSRYAAPGRRFLVLDIVADPLPRADVVLCRDCLVHLSFDNIARALANLRQSGAEYLLTTTSPGVEENRDCEDGDWRPLNLELPPFGLPPPLDIVLEGCTEAGGAYADKSLGLWRCGEF